jgi:hypothetical protein
MRRKNGKWVAMAAALYLFLMWSAYRWAIAQRPADGNILDHRDRESARKKAEALAKEAAAQPQPNGESRLAAAGPAFVAARYDATHVVFMLAAETESRFAASPQFSGTPAKLPAPSKSAAPLAGLQELWEPDSQALHFFPESIQKTRPGDQWMLDVSPDSAIPVVIDRVVIAPTGCSLALGFLASVPPDQQRAFTSSPQEYFSVRRTPVKSVDPPAPSHIAGLPGWRPSPETKSQIEQQLTARMKQELARIDARLVANAASPGATAGDSPVGHARPRLKEWIHVDQGLTRGEGTLDYDIRALLLTPDATPRLFVRARWKLVDTPVFLMTAWFRAESSTEESRTGLSRGTEGQVILLSSDSSWATELREEEYNGTLGDRLDFQTILNEFDADHDGWAELLIHSDHGASTAITLYLYTDVGLVPMKTPLRRDTQSPESCVSP